MEGRTCILRNNTPLQAGLHVRVHIFLVYKFFYFAEFVIKPHFHLNMKMINLELSVLPLFEATTHVVELWHSNLQIKILNKFVINKGLI